MSDESDVEATLRRMQQWLDLKELLSTILMKLPECEDKRRHLAFMAAEWPQAVPMTEEITRLQAEILRKDKRIYDLKQLMATPTRREKFRYSHLHVIIGEHDVDVAVFGDMSSAVEHYQRYLTGPHGAESDSYLCEVIKGPLV